MKAPVAFAVGIGMLTVWAPAPARPIDVLAAQDVEHEQQQSQAGTPVGTSCPQCGASGNMMMGNMMAADAKLDELVRKMNDARGQAKTDAIAEVVTALVQQHRTMRGMMGATMGPMPGMTNMPGGPGRGGATPAPPEK